MRGVAYIGRAAGSAPDSSPTGWPDGWTYPPPDGPDGPWPPGWDAQEVYPVDDFTRDDTAAGTAGGLWADNGNSYFKILSNVLYLDGDEGAYGAIYWIGNTRAREDQDLSVATTMTMSADFSWSLGATGDVEFQFDNDAEFAAADKILRAKVTIDIVTGNITVVAQAQTTTDTNAFAVASRTGSARLILEMTTDNVKVTWRMKGIDYVSETAHSLGTWDHIVDVSLAADLLGADEYATIDNLSWVNEA